jgi:hypothetical protein
MDYHFRKAELSEITPIWAILKDAIARRKQDGSTQWQRQVSQSRVQNIEKAKDLF